MMAGGNVRASIGMGGMMGGGMVGMPSCSWVALSSVVAQMAPS